METSRRSTNSLAEELLQEAQARASSKEGMERFVHVLLSGLPAPEQDFLIRLQAYVATKRAWYRYRKNWRNYLYRYEEPWPSRFGYISEGQVKHARYEYKEFEQEAIDEIGLGRVKELKRQQAALWGSPWLVTCRTH